MCTTLPVWLNSKDDLPVLFMLFHCMCYNSTRWEGVLKCCDVLWCVVKIKFVRDHHISFLTLHTHTHTHAHAHTHIHTHTRLVTHTYMNGHGINAAYFVTQYVCTCLPNIIVRMSLIIMMPHGNSVQSTAHWISLTHAEIVFDNTESTCKNERWMWLVGWNGQGSL